MNEVKNYLQAGLNSKLINLCRWSISGPGLSNFSTEGQVLAYNEGCKNSHDSKHTTILYQVLMVALRTSHMMHIQPTVVENAYDSTA